MNFNPLTSSLLAELRSTTVQTFMTETCLLYRSLGTGPAGTGASDGRGGYGDGRGGQQSPFAPPVQVPCMKESALGGSETVVGGISQSTTEVVLYLPYETQVSSNDEIEYQGARYTIDDVQKDTDDFNITVRATWVRG